MAHYTGTFADFVANFLVIMPFMFMEKKIILNKNIFNVSRGATSSLPNSWWRLLSFPKTLGMNWPDRSRKFVIRKVRESPPPSVFRLSKISNNLNLKSGVIAISLVYFHYVFNIMAELFLLIFKKKETTLWFVNKTYELSSYPLLKSQLIATYNKRNKSKIFDRNACFTKILHP